MITKEQAMSFDHRKELWHVKEKNADGTPIRCRVNGKCKTWKTRPEEFRLPVKHGLRDCFYITPNNAADWYDPEETERLQFMSELADRMVAAGAGVMVLGKPTRDTLHPEGL